MDLSQMFHITAARPRIAVPASAAGFARPIRDFVSPPRPDVARVFDASAMAFIAGGTSFMATIAIVSGLYHFARKLIPSARSSTPFASVPMFSMIAVAIDSNACATEL